MVHANLSQTLDRSEWLVNRAPDLVQSDITRRYESEPEGTI
jgi:hypothetical protein